MESLDSLHSWVLFQPFGMLPLGLVPWLVCVRAKGNFITFSFQQLEGRVIAQLRWAILIKWNSNYSFWWVMQISKNGHRLHFWLWNLGSICALRNGKASGPCAPSAEQLTLQLGAWSLPWPPGLRSSVRWKQLWGFQGTFLQPFPAWLSAPSS